MMFITQSSTLLKEYSMRLKYGFLLAIVVLVAAPVLALFGQRWLVKGLTHGGVK